MSDPTLETSDVAAVVVAYRPPRNVRLNIESYLADVCKVYLVDNSAGNARLARIARDHRSVEHVVLGGNRGLAEGLNVGITRALDDGYSWVLTMDQDSRATDGMLDEMKRCYWLAARPEIAVVTPWYKLRLTDGRTPDTRFEFVESTMGSGNLIDARVCRKLGMFPAELFIDGIDCEYCMRVVQSGHLIVKANHAVLEHELGRISSWIMGRVPITNHPAVRRYYLTRNRFVIARRHGISFVKCALLTAAESLLVLFCEGDKLEKLKMMLRGLIDYRRRRLGKYSRG